MVTIGGLASRIAITGAGLLLAASCNTNQEQSVDSFYVPLTVKNPCDRHVIVAGFGHMPRLGPVPELTAVPAPSDELRQAHAVDIPPNEERVVNIVAAHPGWVVYLKVGSEKSWFAYYSKAWEEVEATKTISLPRELCQ